MNLIMEREQRSSKCVPKCCLFLFFVFSIFYFFNFFFLVLDISSKLITENWGETALPRNGGTLFFPDFFFPVTVIMSSCRKCILIREKIAVPRMMICARLKFSLPLQGD